MKRQFRAVVSLGLGFTPFVMGTPAAAVDDGEVSGEVLYNAVDVLTGYLEEDLDEVSRITKKTAVVNYTQSGDLPDGIKPYLLKKMERATISSTRHPVRMIQCIDCLTMKAEARGDEIFVKKGISSDAELKSTLDKLDVKTYSDIHLASSGRHLVLQVSLMDANKVVKWSEEYKTPYSAYEDSQWMLGASLEGIAYQKEGFPSSRAGRLYVGQRLFGIGAVGLAATLHDKSPELDTVNTYGTFFELNHNEFFAQYWEHAQLIYQAEIGISDFNGHQQFTESVGVKAKVGQYYTVRLAGRMHQFIKTPEDDSEVYNPNGKSIIRNNEPLPTQVSLGIGVEML